MEAKVSDQQCR